MAIRWTEPTQSQTKPVLSGTEPAKFCEQNYRVFFLGLGLGLILGFLRPSLRDHNGLNKGLD